MDKVKVFLAVLKKHQFWVLCGVMLITILACWWLATDDLASQFQARVSQIKTDFTGTKVPPEPANQSVIDNIDEQHKSLKQEVFRAWATLYKQQKENNPLPAVLGKAFNDKFEKLKPQGKLDRFDLEQYQNRILKDYLPGLQKIVDVRRPVDDKAAGDRPAGTGRGRAIPGMQPGMQPGMMGGDAVANTEMTGIVDWNSSDIAVLESRFDWPTVPSTLDVVLAQEDLWVYESLLRVIKSTNDGATNQSNAAVKRIDALHIGRDCRQAWKETEESAFHKASGGPGGPGGPGQMPDARQGPPPGMGPGGGGGSNQHDQDLFVNRYVDDKGQPLAVKGDFPFVDHPIPEYKMMPIHLKLVMDQRSLPKFLAKCANSNMPVEVRRVRILKESFSPFDFGAAANRAGSVPGGMSGGDRASGAYPRVPPMGHPEGRPDAGGMNSLAVDNDNDIPVEIFAVIYIYNRPDEEKLGVAAAGSAPADPSGAAATTPANNKPAAAPARPATPGK
jgi:hypothetical protein